jgi:TnpA family transposase
VAFASRAGQPSVINIGREIADPEEAKVITAQWEEVLRLAASIRHGTVTASLIIRKLASYPRQNSLHVTSSSQSPPQEATRHSALF